MLLINPVSCAVFLLGEDAHHEQAAQTAGQQAEEKVQLIPQRSRSSNIRLRQLKQNVMKNNLLILVALLTSATISAQNGGTIMKKYETPSGCKGKKKKNISRHILSICTDTMDMGCGWFLIKLPGN